MSFKGKGNLVLEIGDSVSSCFPLLACEYVRPQASLTSFLLFSTPPSRSRKPLLSLLPLPLLPAPQNVCDYKVPFCSRRTAEVIRTVTHADALTEKTIELNEKISAVVTNKK